MIEYVLPGIYRLEIPIPRSPLKATNAYLIVGEERNLLIDTGLNHQESLMVMRKALHELSVDMAKTDILLTHFHADHVGLSPDLATDTSRVYASAPDAVIINSFLTGEARWQRLYDAARLNGFPREEARKAIERHPGNAGSKYAPLRYEVVKEGTELNLGGYNFICIETPGHTAGHICLYEPHKRLLVSGDHILGDISPNITHYLDRDNPLEEFLSSLKKVAALPVDLVLPGHRRVFSDCGSRISELLDHHGQRLEEVYAIMSEGPLTGYEVAARMSWDLVYRRWEDVAVPQKFFATGEALSHLRYLECQGLLKQSREDDVAYYCR